MFELNDKIILETNYGKLEGNVVSITTNENIEEGVLLKMVLTKPIEYPIQWYDTKIGMRWKESMGSLANTGRNTKNVTICFCIHSGKKIWISPTFLSIENMEKYQ
jgi:hypothetical protein